MARALVAVRTAPLLASPLLQPSPAQGGGTLRPRAASPSERRGTFPAPRSFYLAELGLRMTDSGPEP